MPRASTSLIDAALSAMTCAARSMAPAFSNIFDAVATARSSSGVKFAMRPHASAAAAKSCLFCSCMVASFFSSTIFFSRSPSAVASCSSRFARSSHRWVFSSMRVSDCRAPSSLRSRVSSCFHALMAPSVSRRLPSHSPATSRSRSLRASTDSPGARTAPSSTSRSEA